MEDLVFKRPRRANHLGTFPLAAAGALLREIPGAGYELAILAVTVPCAVAAGRTRSTTVTAEGILIRAVRRRFIPWDMVRAISVDSSAGDRSIGLRLTDGSRRRLPAPVERRRRLHGAEFDTEYAAIMEAWLRSTGPAER
ncbi:MAG: hypothetical protein HOV83_38475 [Catenulispora sp.]|nr:hypothetical protein [Catenulispora sp.]